MTTPLHECRWGVARWVLAACCAGVALAGAPGVAAAREPAAKAASSSEVDALLERGIALRRAGEDAEALPLFQQAEQLDADSARVNVHLAATYQALGQWEAADRYLTRALKDPSDPYIQKHQATLAAARRTIDGHIGQLSVSGGPRGTEVRLNGRLIGTLPFDETVRVEAGIYTLEARLPGHYPVTRSVALAGGSLARETIDLEPRLEREERSARANGLAPAPPQPAPEVDRGGTSWLTWTFGGLALAGGVVTGLAWVDRENHADRWNDDERCLGPGQTREQLCGSELDEGKRAETLMWIGGGAALAFTGAAVVSALLSPRREAPEDVGTSCGVGWAQLSCAGHF